MSVDTTVPPSSGIGTIARTPREIADDITLTNARKIELLTSFKEQHAAPEDEGILRDADRELEKLLDPNSPANRT